MSTTWRNVPALLRPAAHESPVVTILRQPPKSGPEEGETSSARRAAAPPLPGGIEVVLFDVGHTLVHSNLQHAREVMNEVTAAIHREVVALGFAPPALGKYIRTAKWRVLIAAIWSRMVRREVQVIEMIRLAHARIGIHLDGAQLHHLAIHGAIAIWDLFQVDPDAREMLETLRRRGYRLGLISNTWLPGVLLDHYLRDESLLDYFPVRVYSSEIRYMKPDPRIFDHALRELEVAPARCVFVGDRLDNDVRGACRAGMRTIHFATRRRFAWRAGKPDHVVRRLSEIPAVLSSLA